MIWEQIDEDPREVGQSGIVQRARSKPRNRLNSLLDGSCHCSRSPIIGAIGPERLACAELLPVGATGNSWTII
jgi:hypothetical protein